MHYGDRPPATGTDSHSMTLRSAPPRDADQQQRSLTQQRLLEAFDAERAALDEAAAESAAHRQEALQRCEKASRELARIDRANIVYTTNDSGERAHMTDEDRRKATAEISRWIHKHCS